MKKHPDKIRLDFISTNHNHRLIAEALPDVPKIKKRWGLSPKKGSLMRKKNLTLRAAIDAAMKLDKKRKP